MKRITLGVGEVKASNGKGDILTTYALETCLAVILMQPALHTVGMVHVALPDSRLDVLRSKKEPGYFADTGIAALIHFISLLSGQPILKHNTFAKLTGGSRISDPGTFNVGEGNIIAVREILQDLGIKVLSEKFGDTVDRIDVHVDTGDVLLLSSSKNIWKI